MATKKRTETWGEVLALAERQHGRVARWQLLAVPLTDMAIKHARATARLHPAEWRGVYAVGRLDKGKLPRLSAALLAAGAESTLVEEHAGSLWKIWKPRSRVVEVAV